MNKLNLIAAALLVVCSTVSAQDVVLIGHVQRVILQPSGTENCPPPCPVTSRTHADGSQTVCISNSGGCQMMEVKVARVYRGVVQEQIRQFKSRIGEWGPSFPVTDKLIVVSEEAGRVHWSIATELEGKIFFDPKRLSSLGGIPSSTNSNSELVALDEVLARSAKSR